LKNTGFAAGWLDVVFEASGLAGGPILDNSDDPPALAPPSAPSFFGSGLREKKPLGLPTAGVDEELKKLDGTVLGWALPVGCEDDDGFCSAGLLKNDG